MKGFCNEVLVFTNGFLTVDSGKTGYRNVLERRASKKEKDLEEETPKVSWQQE